MKCNFCNKEYTRETQEIEMFGSKFCLHDDALKNFRKVHGLKNDSVSAKVVRGSTMRTEQEYIETAEKDGDFVVRSSDGLLRRMSDKKEAIIE